jgi:hypothetical protein
MDFAICWESAILEASENKVGDGEIAAAFGD